MCGCGSYDNDDNQDEVFRTQGGTVYEIRAVVRDQDFEGAEEEKERIREALEEYYYVQGDVQLTIVSETDPTSGIRHFAGVEG